MELNLINQHLMLSKNTKIEKFFNALTTFLATEITPIAEQLDADFNLLRKMHHKLVQLGDLELLIPQNYGGMGGEHNDRIAYTILIAEHSGVLLFLHQQHQHSVAQLKKLLPHPKVTATLQASISNHHGIALGLAAGKNVLDVKPTNEGFILSGQLRWVTGFEYFSHILISFDHNDTIFFALLPFKAITLPNAGITISTPIETIIFSAANTVSIQFDNWHIDIKEIITTQPLAIQQPSEHPSIYNFAGAAKALLLSAQQGKYSKIPSIKNTLCDLVDQWQKYYNQVVAGETNFLALRALGLNLAERCAHTARLACGSDALLANHPVPRISREIWQYAIGRLSPAQLSAYFNESG